MPEPRPGGATFRVAKAPVRRVIAGWAMSYVRELVPFLAVAAQFFLIVLLVLRFHLESMTFGRVMQLAFGGFLIHHFLPPRFRLPFFALLSVAATVAVGDTPSGIALVAIGMGLIGVCHLPIAFWGRVALLTGIGAILAVARAQSVWMPTFFETRWAILGSMFAFRLIVYLYDLKHRGAPFGPARAAAYFFMLPNICFPLFPVVDYKTFCTTHYNDQSLRIYQTGIKWMFRGVVQLLLYRLVYHFGPLNIENVVDARDVAGFMFATYLLYLHVSGQFHLIVGLLHMFGFSLPETHHLYLLASSFTDFWRRINIYWKDFILKVFFYPSFFALRKLGTLRAMAMATLAAFFATWVLHSWQWFWFRGQFLVSWQDVSFWSILAVLVLVNALIEAVSGRRRTLTPPRFDPRARLLTGLKTIGTFVVICTLWTLWSCQSRDELQVLVECATRVSWGDAAVIIAGLVAVGAAGAFWGASSRESMQGLPAASAARKPFPFWRSAAGVTAGAACLLAFSGIVAPNLPRAGKLLAALREDQLNIADTDRQRRGYYEELDTVRSNQWAWGRSQKTPAGWIDEGLFRLRDDFLRKELAPSASGMLCGTIATINRWGMRDRDYAKEKPAGTYRFVLLGSSHEVGSGVGDGATFENLVEDRLKQDPPDERYQRHEILNLAVGGYGIFRKLIRLERDGFPFEPDAVLFAVTDADRHFDLLDLSISLMTNGEVPYDYLDDLFRRARVNGYLSELMIQRRLLPYVPEMDEWAFRRLAAQCAERGIRPFVVYRPAPDRPPELDSARHDEIVRAASRAGLEVLDLSSAFDRVKDRDTLILAPWDNHTNATGHRLLADDLYEKLVPRLKSTEGRPPAEVLTARPDEADGTGRGVNPE